MGLTLSRSLFEDPKDTWHEEPGTASASRGVAHLNDTKCTYRPHMTLYTNLMERRAVDDGSRPIFGWRMKDPETGVVGDYEWVTYDAFLDQVADVAAGMKHALGLSRQEPVGIFSKNRYEWVLVEHAANRMAYQLVPLYDTLGPQAVPFIVNHTEMRVLFCGKQQLTTFLGVLSECSSVKIIVQFENDVDAAQKNEAQAKGVEIKTLRELISVGRNKPVNADPPKPEDIATICYTSGTTGAPKGAMLTHSCMVSAAHSAKTPDPLYADDVHLSYLPLAHVFERAIQAAFIDAGACIGFYQGDVTKLVDDFAALKPTVILGAPRVFNRIHDKIVNNVQKAGGVKKSLFDYAYATKKAALADGYITHAFWDAILFNKIKQVIGGRTRLLMSGSAPISPEIKEFLQIVFCCPMIEGYGMTETASVTSLSTPAFETGPHCGLPVPGLEICLVDVPEMNYTSQDQPKPRGEICVRGPNVFKGYYKEPEKTAEVFDNDGWLHTGDIGMWNPDGTLSIIDRKKNIFKLSQGEYVAPEKIENAYLKSPLVAQMLVHGSSLQNYLVGVVVPDAEAVAHWASQQGITTTDFKELCGMPALKEAILADLEALGDKVGLFGFERVRHISVQHELWSVDNNLITPTFKLKRRELLERFKSEIEALYEE